MSLVIWLSRVLHVKELQSPCLTCNRCVVSKRVTTFPNNVVWRIIVWLCVYIAIKHPAGRLNHYGQNKTSLPGAVSIYRCCLASIEIPIIEIRRSDHRIIFITRIPLPGKMVCVLRQGPAYSWTKASKFKMPSNYGRYISKLATNHGHLLQLQNY